MTTEIRVVMASAARQLDGIAVVMQALDADGIVVVETPDTGGKA